MVSLWAYERDLNFAQPWVWTLLFHILLACDIAQLLNTLKGNFLICKMGMVVTPISIANNLDGQEGKKKKYSGGRSTFYLIIDPNLSYFYYLMPAEWDCVFFPSLNWVNNLVLC